MLANTDQTNKSALNFIRANSLQIMDICAPLKHLGVNSVSYGRFYDDGKRIYLSNNLDWIEFYFKKELYDNDEHSKFYIPPLNTRYLFWSGVKLDSPLQKMIYSQSPFNGGLSVYDLQMDYLDYFGFGSFAHNDQVKNYFINHLDCFEEFMKTFRDKVPEALKSDDQGRLIIPKKFESLSQIRLAPIIEPDNIKNFKRQIGLLDH